MTSLGDSAVVLSGRIWISSKEAAPGGVKAAFTEAVTHRFDEEGVGVPYPHTEPVCGIDVRSASSGPGALGPPEPTDD